VVPELPGACWFEGLQGELAAGGHGAAPAGQPPLPRLDFGDHLADVDRLADEGHDRRGVSSETLDPWVPEAGARELMVSMYYPGSGLFPAV
jgi:hypothetical protein